MQSDIIRVAYFILFFGSSLELSLLSAFLQPLPQKHGRQNTYDPFVLRHGQHRSTVADKILPNIIIVNNTFKKQKKNVQKNAHGFFLHSTQDEDNNNENNENFILPPMERKFTELWLDLRGTAVHPKLATDYVLTELQEDGMFFSEGIEERLIDRVLVSDSSFEKLLQTSDKYVMTSDLLYVPNQDASNNNNNNKSDNDECDFIALSRNGLSYPFGQIIDIPSDGAVAVPDPMQAIQHLLAGKWVVLCNKEEGFNLERDAIKMEAIGSFLDIASTMTGGGRECGSDSSSNLQNGLFLKSNSENQDHTDVVGGVAVVCKSKACVVQLASVLQCFQTASITSVTESGILVQGAPTESSRPTIPTGLILPFDLMLWKAAMLVYGQEKFN